MKGRKMESLDYWRLCDELTIIQAALLLIGCDPGGKDGGVERWQEHERPHGYEAAKAAITNAFRLGRIDGCWIPDYEYDINGNLLGAISDSINPAESRVAVESLRQWLEAKGFRTGFFFPGALDAPDYMNPRHPRYAPKLAAAVSAWLAVTDPGKKTPKQALDKWLREHAAEYGMIKGDGSPSDKAVEECSIVANWNTKGGPPGQGQEHNLPTPSANLPTPPQTRAVAGDDDNFDDDIPF